MTDRPCIILGASTSLFVRHLAAHWRGKGLNPVVVTYDYPVEEALPDGTPVISCVPLSPILSRRIVFRILFIIEYLIVRLFRGHLIRITGKVPGPHMSLVQPLIYARRLSIICASLKPRFVFGQEVTTYGLATACCRGTRRVLFPWGGDIHGYSESSIVAYWIVRYALQRADVVVPSSTASVEPMAERFNVATAKITPVSWGVDRDLFRPATAEERGQIAASYGFRPDAIIFMNIRRFQPLWGCFTVLDTFLDISHDDERYHFILLGGPGEFVDRAKDMIKGRGLQQRFTIMDGDIPLDQVAELMSVSDIAFSLMKHSDMRSFSVLQAAAAGAVPVLSSSNPEFKVMARSGFAAVYVDPDDKESAVRAARRCAEDAAFRDQIRRKNIDYIFDHEDFHKQMDKILQLCLPSNNLKGCAA